MRKLNHLSVWVSTSPLKTKNTDDTIDYFNHVIWKFVIYTHFSYAHVLNMSSCSYHGDVNTDQSVSSRSGAWHQLKGDVASKSSLTLHSNALITGAETLME